MQDVGILLKLINLLADGKFHSEEQFSKVLGINCTIVNKYIQTVRNWGVDILTIPKEGYYLYKPLQLLDKTVIYTHLSTGRLTVLPVTNSTNQYLLERIDYIQSGDACLAEYQTQGRGRYGRRWISPFGNNIYLSIYWCFKRKLAMSIGLSLMVGVVITEILQHFGAEEIRIKWPNDLYLKDRKLAGILVEISNKINRNTHAIIGIGINLAMRKSLSKNITQNWINLQEIGISVDRNILAAELISNLCQVLQQFERDGFAPFASRWRELDIFLNRQVKLLMGKKEIKGIVRGINDHGALLLEQQGKIHTYLSGEVSLYSL